MSFEVPSTTARPDSRAEPTPRLWVVMPAFDEEASVERVIEEWLPELRRASAALLFLAIDDGSGDGTLACLRRAAALHPEVTVATQPNRGHGRTCARGYRAALDGGADWILQLDSDGQCDPRYFAAFWAARANHGAVFGDRRRRDDGAVRYLISRCVSLVALLGGGVWVRDPNVPYRLVRRDVLAAALEHLPPAFELVNVLLAVRIARRGEIRWVPIRFRARSGGVPSLGLGEIVRRGGVLLRQLRAERRRERG